MHVVFICAEYPLRGRSTGGFGTYVDNLTRELVHQKTQVSIFCQGEKKERFFIGSRRIIVLTPIFYNIFRRLKNSPFPLFNRCVAFFIYPLGFGISAAWTARKLNQEQPVDIIEGGDFGAELFFLLILKLVHLVPFPVVVKLHTPSFIIRRYNKEPRSLFYWLLEHLEQNCLYLADGVYSPTTSLAHIVSGTLRREVATVIPYPAKKITTQPVTRDKHLILSIGKLQSKKGVFVLLSAFAHLKKPQPQVKLVYIGSDTLENGQSVRLRLENQITQEKLTGVTLLIPMTQSALANWYQRAAVVAVPSLWENYPNVILEALSYGTPVIASRVGGIPEMVRHRKEALLVRPGDPKSLAKSLEYILTEKGLAFRLVKAGQRRLKMLAGPVIAHKTVLYYQRVIDKYVKSKR